MINKILTAAIVVAILLVPSASYAQVNPPTEWHDVYWQIIPSSPEYPEHGVYHKYYRNAVFHYSDWDPTYDSMTLWTGDTSGAVKNSTDSALSLWGTGGYWPSWQTYQWKLSPTSADVDIFNASCSTPTTAACVSANTFYGVNPHHVRIPQRWNLRLTGNWWSLNSTYRITAMAHEFGHILGRGEAYDYNSSQCGTVPYSSVMDRLINGIPCDSSSPTSQDKQANSYQWTNGYYDYYTYANVSGSHLQAWKDYAWNEGKVLQEWYYWDSGASNYLDFYSAQTMPDDIGSHRTVSDAYSSIDQYISFGIAPSAYGVPYYTTVKLCLTPIMSGIPGERKCSPGVQYTP
jgi:hypothetical protein